MKIHSQGHLEKKISLRPDLGHWTNEKSFFISFIIIYVRWCNFQRPSHPSYNAYVYISSHLFAFEPSVRLTVHKLEIVVYICFVILLVSDSVSTWLLSS